MKPFHIFIDGKELLGWTEASLTREKEGLTGSLNVSIFFTYMPKAPVAVDAVRGKEVTVYVGGHLAFTGVIDKRSGSGVQHGESGSSTVDQAGSGSGTDEAGGDISSSIGPNEYTVTLTARGKTKYLIDSSHQHPTTNMLRPTNREVVDKLIEPWGVELDWLATNIKLDKVRLRDGARVVDELHRIAGENGHFIYETREGKLRVTDDTGQRQGEALVLGTNISTFSAEQSEDQAKSKVKVKGQRIDNKSWGETAVLNTEKEIEDKWVGSQIPYTIQHYGDGTPEALERRANFETNVRSSQSKKLTIEVFHVQTTSGDPWDIGTLHYVEVPPEGIFDVFECVALTYNVKNDETISTTLTLSPPPTASPSSSAGGGLASSLGSALSEATNIGNSRRSAAGITFTPGQYPAPWSSPDVSFIAIPSPDQIVSSIPALLGTIFNADKTPALRLPDGFKSEGE